MKRKAIACMLALLLCCSVLGGCAAKGEEAAASPTETAIDQLNLEELTIATANGREIPFSQLNDMVVYMEYIYQMGGATPYKDSEGMLSFLKSVLNMVIEKEVLLSQCDERGLALSDDETAILKAEYEDHMDKIIEEFEVTARKQNPEGTDAEIAIRAEAMLDENLQMIGMSQESFWQDMVTSHLVDDLLYDSVARDVTVSEEDILAWYESELEAQTKAIGERDTLFEEYWEEGLPCLYIPEGYAEVRYVIYSFEKDEELDKAQSQLIRQRDELAAKLTELLTKNTSSGDEIARLQEEIAAVKAEINALAEQRKAVQDARLFHAELEKGASFTELFTTLDESVENSGDEVYLIGPHSAYVDEILTVCAGFESDGDYSDVIITDDSCYILYCERALPAGSVAFDEVREACEEAALVAARGTLWQETKQQWVAEADIWIDEAALNTLCGIEN